MSCLQVDNRWNAVRLYRMAGRSGSLQIDERAVEPR